MRGGIVWLMLVFARPPTENYISKLVTFRGTQKVDFQYHAQPLRDIMQKLSVHGSWLQVGWFAEMAFKFKAFP